MKRLHLVCNAHLDPYWLWEWEEGAAEAISTFRTAAELCEENDSFVFNHNEVILYKWVEEFEPALFARIQKLVKAGKWHIMGGWYLQPDCNMPSGESFARQALLGKRYFNEKFGVEPTTAINFDPFGHTRGLVQILKKAGYDSYLVCRPGDNDCPLPDHDVIWVGYDGSEVAVLRSHGWYSSNLGRAREKIEALIDNWPGREIGLILWGVGNHGGGPSRQDLEDLEALRAESDTTILHSTPESYFHEFAKAGLKRELHAHDMNPWAVGCYTSQVRLKQKHRLLENEIYMLEKMASTAALQGLMEYPAEDMHAALCDLMVGEFHDILPGSSIQGVEEAGLRLFDHGLEIVSRLKARAFFALAAGQPRATEGRIPIFAYNPHPFPIRQAFEVEFNLPDVNVEEQFTVPHVYAGGERLPSQAEKEVSNLNIDWRKRCIFHAELKPSQMNRFDCELEVLPARPKPGIAPEGGAIEFEHGAVEVVINTKTGLLDKYAVDGVEYVRPGAFQLVAIQDDEDPWGMRVQSYRDEAGCFTLMSPVDGTAMSALKVDPPLPSVRIIEDGEVRTVVEALFEYGHSMAVITYRLPKHGAAVEVHVRVHWNEKDTMLKLALPVALASPRYLGQVAYGCDELPGAEREVVGQKWVAAANRSHALTLVNESVYGSDFPDNTIRMSLMRSPAYSGHPWADRNVVEQDRFTPRIDQGERQFTFWMEGGACEERLTRIDREALAYNEKPFLVSFYPHGDGELPEPGLTLSDEAIQVTAFKMAEDGSGYVLRLFEPTGQARSTTLRIPALALEEEVSLSPFELRSYRLDPAKRSLVEVDLIERPV